MARRQIKTAFHSNIISLNVSDITPLKELNPRVRSTTKYKQIATSLKHVGLIEPLIVFQAPNKKYWLLDGTLRYDIIRSADPLSQIRCLCATDDESYNYNKRVSYLPPIAEHGMILKALSNGVAEARIAEALNVDVAAIRKKRHLLDGICDEAATLLKDKHVTADGFGTLRKMKPVRQIYAAEMMIAGNNFSTKFARGLLGVTKPEFLVNPTGSKSRTITANQKSIMEQESDLLIEDLKEVQKDYSNDLLGLTVSAGYLERILHNSRVERYIAKHHLDVLEAVQHVLIAVDEEKQRSSLRKKSA